MKSHPVRPSRSTGSLFPALLLGSLLTAGSAGAATVIFADNFNVANNTLDGVAQGPDRYSGLLAGTTESHAALSQSNVVSQAIATTGGGAAIRFVESTNLASRRNFAAGAAGAAIIAAGGFEMSLDRTQSSLTGDSWVGIGVGSVINGDSWVNGGELDFGMLIRNNGNGQRFDNGAVADILPVTVPTLLTQHYAFTFLLDPQAANPFADGASVTISAKINGVTVPVGPAGATSYNFTWANNGGNIQLQYFWDAPGGTIDNVAITTIPEPAIPALGMLCGMLMLRRRAR